MAIESALSDQRHSGGMAEVITIAPGGENSPSGLHTRRARQPEISGRIFTPWRRRPPRPFHLPRRPAARRVVRLRERSPPGCQRSTGQGLLAVTALPRPVHLFRFGSIPDGRKDETGATQRPTTGSAGSDSPACAQRGAGPRRPSHPVKERQQRSPWARGPSRLLEPGWACASRKGNWPGISGTGPHPQALAKAAFRPENFPMF